MTARLRRPAAVGALVALVVLAGWYQLLWQPQGAALAAAHRQTQAASTNLFTVEQSVGHLKHLKALAPQLAALEQKLSAAAPPSDQVDQFLLTLNDLSLQSGVTVGAISLSQPAASSGGLATLAVHLSVSGDYFAVQQFLDLLRASQRIVLIDSLSETPSKGSGNSGAGNVLASLAVHLLTGLVAPSPAVQKALVAPPSTAAPTGIISGPVTKARNAVANANANSTQLNAQANTIGSP
jgi:Tfp pilus assembly protein PilO